MSAVKYWKTLLFCVGQKAVTSCPWTARLCRFPWLHEGITRHFFKIYKDDLCSLLIRRRGKMAERGGRMANGFRMGRGIARRGARRDISGQVTEQLISY